MEYVFVGKFLGTHGLKGEIKLKTDFKYLDKIFKDGFKFYIGDKKIVEEFSGFRKNKDIYLVSLKDIDNIDDAKTYVNNNLYVDKSDLDLEKNQYIIEDLLNKKAYFNNSFLGTIEEINDYGNGNYVMTIHGKREFLIPFKTDFIDKVNEDVYLKNVEVFINEN